MRRPTGFDHGTIKVARSALWAALCTLSLAVVLVWGLVPTAHAGEVVLFDAADGLKPWRQIRFDGSTAYGQVNVDGVAAIRARGSGGASMLVHKLPGAVRRAVRGCTALSWRWRVDALQTGADIAVKAREDVAAAIYLQFADSATVDDPVLRYVWTNRRYAPETVVDSPYLPGRERSLVVVSGPDQLGDWVTVQRDLKADYLRLFGGNRVPNLDGVALFTDNDQTGEPVLAYYGRASLTCP